MYKNERDFQNTYIQHLKKEGRWVYKIPDVNMQIKPFDIIATREEDDGNRPGKDISKVRAIELKHCNLKKGVSYEQAYKMLRPNQVGALADIQNHGAESLVVVYNAATDTIHEREFKLLDIGIGEL